MPRTDLARYSLLPWLRQGLGTGIVRVPAAGEHRATVAVDLEVSTDNPSLGTETITNQLALIGPGDIVGVVEDAIVRTEPADWTTEFEPNLLALIELYDEDFPWRYTPAPASREREQLTPWLALAVLREDEFESLAPGSAPLPALRTLFDVAELLPPPGQLWAWAHVHVDADLAHEPDGSTRSLGRGLDALSTALETNPDVAHSRILCPRKLEPNTGYHAFLIPTFEVGRRAGLGLDLDGEVGAMDPAWSSGAVELPYYHRWYFRTGERGDFEYLVRKLAPRPVDPRLGTRDMDVSDPGPGISAIDRGPEAPPVLAMEGALRAPGTRSTAWPESYPDPFQRDAAELVNQPAVYQDAHPGGDPVVSPPLYGRWHAMRDRLSLARDTGSHPYDPGAKWLTELNLDPRWRAAAGLGVRVVQACQEALMNQAWQQIGDVLEANRRLRPAELAEGAGESLARRRVGPMSQARRLWWAAPVHKRILDGGVTLYGRVRQSRLPASLFSPELRRALRRGGPLARRLFGRAGADPAGPLVSGLNEGALRLPLPKDAPGGAVTVQSALESVDSEKTQLVAWLLTFSEQALDEIPGSPQFRVTGLDYRESFPTGDEDSEEARRFRSAARDLHALLSNRPDPPSPRPPLDTDAATARLLAGLAPRITIRDRVMRTIVLPEELRRGRPDRIAPVMAHPEFPQPMYEPLRDLGVDLLLPNLHLIPPNTLSLVETNPTFIESFMVGLNHEIGRELLWREYPTDLRGTSAAVFWTPKDDGDRDIPPIHTWPNPTPLGSNALSGRARLVLVVRGDLLKRYPNAAVYAHRAAWRRDDAGEPLPAPRVLAPTETETDARANIRHPLYSARVTPDIFFLGFDLTVEQARGDGDDPGWFFAFKERAGDVRFGVDVEDDSVSVDFENWDDLSWADLAADVGPRGTLRLPDDPARVRPLSNPESIQWYTGSNAADIAHVLLQDPVVVAVHGEQMLR